MLLKSEGARKEQLLIVANSHVSNTVILLNLIQFREVSCAQLRTESRKVSASTVKYLFCHCRLIFFKFKVVISTGASEG